MILNCYTCGKSVSNKINLCPYCKAEVVELELHHSPLTSAQAGSEGRRKTLTGSLLSFVFG